MKIIRTRRVTPGPVYRFLKGMDLPSLSKIGRFSIFLSVAWVGRSLFVSTSPSNSTVLSMASRFSSECLEGIVSFASFASFAFVFTAMFSCGTASRAEAEGGPEEMAMIAVAQCSYRPGSRSSDSCKVARLLSQCWYRLEA